MHYTVTESFNPPLASPQAWANLFRWTKSRGIVGVTTDLEDRPHFYVQGKHIPDALVSGGDTDEITQHMMDNHPDFRITDLDRDRIPKTPEDWHVFWWFHSLATAHNLLPFNEFHYTDGHIVFDHRATTVSGDADRIDIELNSLRARVIYDPKTCDLHWFCTNQRTLVQELTVASIRRMEDHRIPGIPGDFIVTLYQAFRKVRDTQSRLSRQDRSFGDPPALGSTP